MNKFLNSPLQTKIISACVLANITIFIVNLFLIVGINSMSKDMEMVYESNRSLNELSVALNMVQDSMTEYLSSKTSDSLENYYINAQKFKDLTDDLGDKVTDFSFNRMERNIKYMSGEYLEQVEQTIEAKRGRKIQDLL